MFHQQQKGEDDMTSVWKYLAAVGAAFVIPAAASAAERPASGEPVKLADHELDQVVAGDGSSLLDLPLNLNLVLKNINVTVNVSNVPINAGVALQANVLGTAAQTASVQALQSVTQIQTLPGLH
jgi:hypothetical protein